MAGALKNTFETNDWGVLMVCQAFLPSMIERGYGRVVNVSSRQSIVVDGRVYACLFDLEGGAECP